MMRRIICTLLCLLSFLTAFSKVKVTLMAFDVAPQERLTVSLSMSGDDAIYGGEFKIAIPDGFRYVENSFKATTQLHAGQLLRPSFSKGVLSVYAFSPDLSSLPFADVAFFTFELKAGSMPGVFDLQPQVVLSDVDGNASPVEVEGVTVKILAPLLEVSTEEMDFGRVPIRDVYHKSFTIANRGTSTLSVTRINCSSDVFSLDDTTFDLAPGGSRVVTLTFSPLNRGIVNDSITISSNAPGEMSVVRITGSAYSVNELHVKEASCFAGSEVEIGLAMNNMEPISVFQCSFVLPQELQYVKGSFQLSERAKGFQQIESYSDNKLTLSFYSTGDAVSVSEGEGDIATFKVKANGISGTYPLLPESVVLGNYMLENMLSAVQSGSVTLRSPSLSCEDSFHMSPASVKGNASQSFVLKNVGTSRLTILDASFADAGYAISEKLPLSALPGRSLSLTVVHDGGVPGDFATVMQIVSDDPVNAVRTVSIDGSFYEPNELLLLKSVSTERNTCEVTVGMENYSEIVGVQMNINGLENMNASAADVHLSTRCGHLSPIVRKKDDGTFLITLYSMGNAPIADHGGLLFSVLFHGDEDMSGKPTVTLSDMILSNRFGENVASSYDASDTRHLIDLFLVSDGNSLGRTRIVFNNEKSVFFDSGCDAQMMAPVTVSPETCYFYTTDRKGVMYAINERPVNDGVVPLSVVAYQDRDLSIFADRMECSAILYDKLLDVKHALADGPYSFTIGKGVTDDRFEIQLPAMVALPGDANGDGYVTVSDMPSIIDFLGGHLKEEFNAYRADVNNDGIVDKEDIVALRNLLLNLDK